MKVIGITGGVGAGKSTVLDIIKNICNCYILIADEVAHEIEKSGNECFERLVELLSKDILGDDGEINKQAMAAKMFADPKLVTQVNQIVHPMVKSYILEKIEEKRNEATVDFFFIEAALLIEDGYKNICDELWYIYADENVRIKRLVESRGYSLEKIRNIMDKQCSEETFRTECAYTVENNGDLKITSRQIRDRLGL